MNAAQILVKAARERPNHPALLFENQTYTYREFDQITAKFASAAQDSGLSAGKVVAIDLESTAELLIAYLGAIKAGMVPNVINAMLRAQEIKYILSDSNAEMLVTDLAHFTALQDHLPDLPHLRYLILTDGQVPGKTHSFGEFVRQGSPAFDVRDMEEKSLASLLYTSGTTGFPKGVMLSHLNIADNAKNFGAIHYRPDDVVMIASPLFHCWGLINGVLAMFHAMGAAAVVRRFQTEPTLDLIETWRPSIFHGVPTMYNYMLSSPSIAKRDIRSIRFVLSAAAAMPVDLIEALENRFGIGYAEAYGLTETSPVITTAPFTETRRGSCGKAMGDTQLKVCDDQGCEVPQGERGELWARGTAIMLGYLNKPEATNEVITRDAWFKTGDIVRIDADGYVYIVDRKKDMINVGGEKVFHREVEEVIRLHPKVADVAIVGVPDPQRGEVPKAIVVPKPGENIAGEEIVEFCRERIASFKVPREVTFASEIPRSASGKTLRRVLRDG